MNRPDWRLQSLRSFWQGINWDNRAIAPVISNPTNSASTLSLLMSVREYFRSIAWTGIPDIASTAIDPKLNPKLNSNSNSAVDENRETLEDFLDDISKFF